MFFRNVLESELKVQIQHLQARLHRFDKGSRLEMITSVTTNGDFGTAKRVIFHSCSPFPSVPLEQGSLLQPLQVPDEER